MKSTRLIAVIMLLVMSSFSPQTGKVTGRVTSSAGAWLSGVRIQLLDTPIEAFTDAEGRYSLQVPDKGGVLRFSLRGFASRDVAIKGWETVDVSLAAKEPNRTVWKKDYAPASQDRMSMGGNLSPAEMREAERQPEWNTEEYDAVHENIFHRSIQNPLSTFSIDVDAAAYSNVRRFIRNGQRPPIDAVRIEELVNYFDYDYAEPKGEDPFSINTEVGAAPWNAAHRLVHIGLQGKRIPTDHLPPSNLVFLIDVSGSMNVSNKLPLLKASLKLLIGQLREQDRIAIVVYAGAAGLVLPPTSGCDKMKILGALDQLQAGGSTAGGAGIQLAYTLARENYLPKGNNRVILATDGDFNVGESSNGGMERLIEQKRDDGIFLTVLGFGMGNYKDSKMEILADKGNGNYAYIDNILEVQKVLVTEFGGTLFTIAKDVKVQVEFNPAKVGAWRLIGYENRVLKNEDFNNDKKDAGDLGSGHTVTALYEVIPQGIESEFVKIDPLKYQQQKVVPSAERSDELMTIKFRYKSPQGEVSKLIVHSVKEAARTNSDASENFRWSAAVAAFGMLLRNSEYAGNYSYSEVVRVAESARGIDKEGYRAEFIGLIKSVGLISRR